MKKDHRTNDSINMNLVMALSVYGRVILGDPKRIEEGKRCLK